MKDLDKHWCPNYRQFISKIIAPRPMAWLIKRGNENRAMDKANVERLTKTEIKEMGRGIMPTRHFERKTYCENIQISYE